jgi:protein-S-isoprenylcysteine O-methyltransferase Ste14
MPVPGTYDYGHWGAVLGLLLLGGLFVLGFIRPRRGPEWRSAGLFSAFFIALFTEMYGLPLTIYVLSSLLGIDLPFTHIEGHLWASLLGLGPTAAMLICQFGSLLMLAGGCLVIRGWRLIYRGGERLVTEDLYRYIRHPQYLGLILITVGMFIQWPTLLTIAMWPVLIIAYYRLARREEREMEARYGKTYRHYRARTPMLIPRLAAILSGTPGIGEERHL